MKAAHRMLCVPLCLLGLCTHCDRVFAQSCSDIPVQLPTNTPRTRVQLTSEIAKLVRMSVVAEFTYSQEPKLISPPPEASTVADFVSLFGDGDGVNCVVEDHVIHIFETAALQSNENALNYIFSDFSVPVVADSFVIRFRLRLLAEAFRSEDMGLVSGSDAGATPNDADKYKLVPESLKDIEARKLLLREAAAVPMLFVVEVHTDPVENKKAAWEQSNKKLLFAVIR